ncbi:MAG: lytic transglycosylase domain-containing protein, partial [Proteobacteria bacterium]|nr:lytic transglycosylase domain-containing protein [Pseudomonadota bacterium]
AAYIEQVLGVYKKALHNFVVFGPAARTQSPLAAKIWNIYASDRESRLRLLQGKIELRCQAGLADTFSQALKVSELYLPQMERIFREHQLPVELTRLVYVESMFNLKARSKVGASGIWQLMPQAARAYLHIRGGRDERNSPLLATRAAAKIMQNNYATLQSWPLAITAYNHGLGGMRRAVTQTGSRGLGDNIAAYRSPSYGFASRNFDAEFLAVLRLHNRHYGNLKEPQLAEQGTRRDAALQDITQGK